MINVIIPAYNCAKTLGRTLASLVAQTDQNFEVIVVDDCSIEDISYIVEDYSRKLKINYIRHEKNVGCGMSRQTGIDNVTASHFMFLDSDDVLMPYTIESFNAYIKNKPQTEFLHTHFYEQGVSADGIPVYLKYDRGFNWCHGKLYNAEKIKQFGICSKPEVKWADDSYFNALCCELLEVSIFPLITYVWTNTASSVMREKNSYRDKYLAQDFIRAMIFACEFIRQYKEEIIFLPGTIEMIKQKYQLGEEELKLLEQLSSYQIKD